MLYEVRNTYYGRRRGHVMRISITGTPGVGKTKAAEKVSTVLQLTHINVSQAAVTTGAVVQKDEDTSVVDVDILRKKLEKMDDIVIDSHFAEVFDADFVFVLRCEPKILYNRLKERGYTKEKIKEISPCNLNRSLISFIKFMFFL